MRSENILLDEAEMENVVEQNEAEGTGQTSSRNCEGEEFQVRSGVLLALSDGTELTVSLVWHECKHSARSADKMVF